MSRSPRLAACVVLASAAVALAGAADAQGRGRGILVKFRADGESALGECAEALTRAGRRFQPVTADDSDSLDRLYRELGVRRVRALYRVPDGRPFAEQRRQLLDRSRPSLPDVSHVYALELPEGTNAAHAAARYRLDPHVEYAQEDFAIQASFVPNDPFFGTSGSWGQSYADLWGLHRIQAPGAWDVSQGEGILVAVVDTGLDYDHPDMAANAGVHPGEDLNANGVVDDSDFNGLDDDGNGFIDDVRGFNFLTSDDVNEADPFDDNGHGSHVAGIIAAVGNNGIGITGVAPRARILPLKVLNEFGSGSISNAVRAIVYAANNGAHVINNSWSCGGGCPSNPVAEEAVHLATDLGVVVVFAAGNRSGDVAWLSPQNMRETISVAAISEVDRVLDFSNPGFLLDVAAPGGGTTQASVPLSEQNLLSLRSSGRVSGEGQTVGGDYFRLSGTSMSAPHAAGLAALLLAHRPELTPEQVRTALRLSADDLGPEGHDRDHGAGRINATRALQLGALPRVFAEITSPPQRSILQQQVGSVAIRGTVTGDDLARWELFFGRGLAPEDWIPLTSGTHPIDDGILAAWDIRDLENGSYVLRLAMEAGDGSRLEEFAVGSLERISVHRVSSRGASAFDPDVSGDLVVWASRRQFTELDGINLFATDLRDGSEYNVSSAPGDQRVAKIARDTVVWHDRRLDGISLETYACRLDRKHQQCPEVAVALAPIASSPPSASNEGPVWADSRNGAFDLFTCRLVGRRCRATRLAAHASNQFDPRRSGKRLVWRDDRLGPPRLFTCRLTGGSRSCEAREVDPGAGLQLDFSVSGDLVAWEELGHPDRTAIRICDLAAGDGPCDPVSIGTRDPAPSPVLSGQRLAWNSTRLGDDRDIFFCEFDPVTRSCPVQRLTGAIGDQSQPAIDGNWIVWKDLRNGKLEIFGVELPSLDALRDRNTAAGARLEIRVRGRDAAGAPLILQAQQAGGASLVDLGARFRDDGDGRGHFEWAPTPEQIGEHALTFTGISRSQVSTRQTIRVRVEPAGPVSKNPSTRKSSITKGQ